MVEEILGSHPGTRLSRVRQALEEAMVKAPVHWKGYFDGGEGELALERKYSYSDRCRYYWPDAKVKTELDVLTHNLTAHPPPLTLLSQFLPGQYEAVRLGAIPHEPKKLVEDRIHQVFRLYAAASAPAR